MSTDEPVVDDPVTPDTPKEPQAEGLSGGMIAIIVVGAVVILGGGFVLVKFTLGKKKIR